MPSHDFLESKHSHYIHHKKICPPSEIDMFNLRGAKSIKEFHDEMKENGYNYDEEEDGYQSNYEH